MLIDTIKVQIDELIAPEGEPYDDALNLVRYTLTKAIAARGGMGEADVRYLEELLEEVEET